MPSQPRSAAVSTTWHIQQGREGASPYETKRLQLRGRGFVEEPKERSAAGGDAGCRQLLVAAPLLEDFFRRRSLLPARHEEHDPARGVDRSVGHCDPPLAELGHGAGCHEPAAL